MWIVRYVLAPLATVGCFFAQTPAKPILDLTWNRPGPAANLVSCADPHVTGQITTDAHFSVEKFRRPIRKAPFVESPVRRSLLPSATPTPRVRFPARSCGEIQDIIPVAGTPSPATGF